MLKNIHDQPIADFDQVVRARRSVRTFNAEPIAKNTIDDILETARWSPSAHNAQPWRLAVLTNSGAKEELALAMGMVWQQDLKADGTSPLVIDIRTTQSYKRIVGSAAVIITCLTMRDMDPYPDAARQTAERTLAIQSIGAFVQTLLLAAHSRGLGAVWMSAPAFCPDIVVRALKLPVDWEPQAMVLLGYPAEEPSPPARVEPADFAIYR